MKKALQLVLLSLFFQLSAAAQNVKITQNGLNPSIATQWENVATELGYNVSTVPRSILDDNSFFSTTDILIISGGTDSYTVAQLNVVKDFLASGKSVYLQGEYLTTYSNNQFFSQIIASYGDSFTWTGTVDGQLGGANMTIVGSLSYLNNSITSLPYFWYGATGVSTSTRLIPFVYNGTQPLGWMYNPVNASYGRLMLITDQDWIGNVGLYPAVANLMKNILYHLKNKTEGDMNYTPPVVPTNGIVYVKKGGTGWGKSWTGSLPELADALRAAKRNTNIKEIWVAGGTYKPLYSPEDGANFGTNKGSDNAFLMAKDVKIYGGFAGAETQLGQRDWRLNPTVLSGEIQDDANMTNNVYHVVIAAGDVGSATLDGFTVTQGAAYNGTANLTVNGASLEKRFAGGIYNSNSSPLIKNCIITNNSGYFASGFGSKDGSPVLVNTLISKNKNIYNSYSNAFSISSGSPKLINVSIVGNEGTFPILSSGAGELYNSIVWGNTVFGSAPSLSNMTIKNSFVQKEAIGGTGLGADPQFVDAATGNFSLQASSPAIGAGDNSLYTGNLNTDKDLLGNPRLTGTQIDLGAYESLVQNQTITTSNIAKTYGDVAFEPGATASSGLTVTYVSADNSIAEAFQDAADANKWKLKIKKAGTVNITASQAGNGAFSPAPDAIFSLTINQKPVTVSLKSSAVFTKVYDAGTAGIMQATDLMLANGDVVNGDDVQLSLSSATAQYDTKDVGTAKTITLPIASVVLAGAQAGNYKVANISDLSNATAAITPKPLTITANNFSKVYDGFGYSGGNGVSYSAFALGEDPTVLSGTLAYGGTSQGAINTGNYVIVPSGLSSPNYTISYANGQLTISLNNVNVLTFNAQTTGSTLAKTYGDADINASAIASSGLTATYQSSNPAVATVNASGQVSLLQTGTATITVNQAGDANYGAASPIAFQVQVAKKLLTVTANDFSKTYDGVAYTGGNGVSYNGFANGETSSVLGGTLVYGGTSQGALNTGNYSITPSGLTSTNYDFDYKNGTLSIIQSGANVITFNSQVAGATQQLTYGNAAIDASAIASSGLSVSYASNNPAVASVNASGQVQILAAGTAIITASQPGDGNHTPATPVSFTINVQQKALTITANNFNKVYDGQVYATGNGVAYNGFVNGENEQSLQGSLSYTGTAIGAKNVGSYFITPGGYTSGNYAITYQDGSLTITKATLSLTADAKTKVYGTADPALTYTSSGLINGDAFTGALARATGENVGAYIINQGTLTAGNNYTISYVQANLTISNKTLSIVAQAKTKIYGDADPALTYISSGLVGTDVITGSLTRATGENIGTYAISQGTLTAGNNYTISYVPANLTINNKTLSIVAQAKTKVYGDADPALTYTSSGLVGADVITGSLTRATGENVGAYGISQGTLTAGNNYTVSYVPTNLSITKAPLLITANNSVMCQNSNLPNFSVVYSGFKNGDTENSLSTKPTVGTTANSNSSAGVYVLSPAGAVSVNYNISYATGSLTINALPIVAINSNKGLSISKGETLSLTATGGGSYSWTMANGIISGQQAAVLNIRPSQTTTYTVTVTNASGCSQTASITIEVRDDFQAVQATNILTPNGDGVNDLWVVANIDAYPNNTVQVFDRAGRILFTKKGYNNTWDGTVNGQPLAEGTYYYIIDFGTDKLKQKGFITLIRQQ
ncbi:MBG domain-containing protein [Pedobacter sp. KR3-3]|uniref:MBG domain-containing protein n=1 Tax=Pedobacter albus TaxID=3113905 RepID=A0ABU7I792_9SPHI|nr:MBG domain-containing protein [Pedobacter sp. KR3-3]MEE1945232.1 MBG domain-containing protein [Pedobacter sp. KR3-3]